MSYEINLKDDEEKYSDMQEERYFKEKSRACVLVRKTKNIYRKAYSELTLIDLMEKESFENGLSYNFMTNGDIDSLTFIKLILRKYNLDYVLLSTWCMEIDDILVLEEWKKEKKIKIIEAYCGEIFPSSYKNQYEYLKTVADKVCVFRNHAKIFAGYNKKENFYFAVQSSANINTNPRNENTVITIGEDIFLFYYDYFSKINTIK